MEKKHQNRRIFIVVLFIETLFISSIYVSYGIAQDNSYEYKYTGILKKDQNVNEWTNEQWQFYKVIVELGETVNVSLKYNGSLDLDLRMYWKRDNADVQGFNGFDLTHCNLGDYKHADNSQLRTNSTPTLGKCEELEIKNPSYTQLKDQIAYILVFVFEGSGESNFTLESSKQLEAIAHSQVYDCNQVILTLILYIILASLTLCLLYLYIRHRKKRMITPKKEKRKKQKESEEGGVKHIDLDTVL